MSTGTVFLVFLFLFCAVVANATFIVLAWLGFSAKSDLEKRATEKLLVPKSKFALVAAGVLLLSSCVAACFGLPDPGLAVTQPSTDAGKASNGSLVGQPPCRVTGFAEASHEVPDSAGSVRCVGDLVASLLKTPPMQLTIIGRVDNRELAKAARNVYGDNASLGLQRAAAVRDWLERSYARQRTGTAPAIDFDRLSTLLQGGALHVGPGVSNADREYDRQVEVRAIVETPPAPATTPPIKTQTLSIAGLVLNTSVFDINTSLTMLAFLVALSAYLAGVRSSTKGQQSKFPGAKALSLILISVADLPMILAAVCLGLHIFVGPYLPLKLSALLLVWALILFSFAALTMFLLHAREWAVSYMRS